MKSRFVVTFPLVVNCGEAFSIIFTLSRGNRIEFTDGILYMEGDNGSGKTTFINLLSLTTGQIGKKNNLETGSVTFNDAHYRGENFTPIDASKIREKYFCIFPQRAFFLPVSTRDNYMILNGSDADKANTFSDRQSPDMLSGGQQQKTLMDIVLDDKRPVWFLDEPLANLDAERRRYFWKTLKRAYDKKMDLVFFIEHGMSGEIKKDSHFAYCNTLRVFMENRQSGRELEFKEINIYINRFPTEFFNTQIEKASCKKAAVKGPDPRILNGDWGAASLE